VAGTPLSSMMELYAMDKFNTFLIELTVKVLVLVIISAIAAFPIMWIWNDDVVQAVTFAKPITWSNAYSIYLLAHILGYTATADYKDKSDK
jgi:hypothetical protein